MKLLYPLLVLAIQFAFPQERTKPEFKFGGYIKTDVFYDSRQVVNLREGHFSLYPKDIQKDSLGSDINDLNSFNILSIQSRLNCNISGVQIFGAQSSAFIEAEFFGHSESDINGFRLRHAFIKLNWSNAAILLGQYWHPIFIIEVIPEVLSFNTGVPFNPFSRNPQLRFTVSYEGFSLLSALSMERDFTGSGPSGFSSVYLRNSGLPGIDLQVHYKNGGSFFALGTSFKKTLPRSITDKGYRTSQSLNSLSFVSAMKLAISSFNIKMGASYVENGSSFLMLGGYGVKSKDAVTGIEKYKNIPAASIWGEIVFGKDIKAGVFAGFTKTLGSDENLAGSIYSREASINRMFRISPRIVYTINELQVGTELEYMSVYYGKVNNKGIPENLRAVSNTRLLFSVLYVINF